MSLPETCVLPDTETSIASRDPDTRGTLGRKTEDRRTVSDHDRCSLYLV